MEIHSNDKFMEDFTQVITNLEERKLNEFLEIAKIFSQSSSTEENYLTFQFQILNILGPSSTPVILHFIKTNESIDIPEKIHRKKFAMLNKIKLLLHNKITTIEQGFSSPFKLTRNIFSYNNEYPTSLTVSLTRGDLSTFKFLLTLNDGMHLGYSLLDNLTTKIRQGHNDINLDLLTKLDESYKGFYKEIQTAIEEIKNSQEQSE